MRSTKELFSLLGYRVRDKVTEVQGVVTSVSFDLYGCRQVLVNRGYDKDGKMYDLVWLDDNRVEVTFGSEKVMPPPDFLSDRAPGKGPEVKPSFSSIPGK